MIGREKFETFKTRPAHTRARVEAMRNEAHPIELRLAAAKAAAPFFHARISAGLPKASFEMTAHELETAIAREKEYLQRAEPFPGRLRVVR